MRWRPVLPKSVRRSWRDSVLAIVAVALTACAGGQPGTPVPAGRCVERGGALGPGATMADMSGRYRLVMINESGGESRSAEGMLELRPQPADLRQLESATTPLGGSTDIDVEAVGARRPGDLGAQDPAAPGVLVIESDGAEGRSILLRMGSDVNARDVLAFDAAYTVLSVQRLDRDSFSGAWRSGVRAVREEGYFCAVRAGE